MATMKPELDVKQDDNKEISEFNVDIPQRASRWSYLAAAGLALGWVAQVQLFSESGLLLPLIDADLGKIRQYPWVFQSFLFGAAILSPPAGAFADTLGRKWFVVLGNLISIIGGIVCATAHSVNIVIVGMAIAGVGSTGQHFAIAGISELFPRRHRGLAQGALQVAGFPFTACGILIAAKMWARSTWRWAYYVYILISGLALVLTFLFYDPPVPESRTPTRQYLKRLDWSQPALIILATTSIALGGGFAIFAIYPWDNSAVLVPIFFGLTILALWVYRVRTYKGLNPLFPREIFTKEMVLLIIIGILISFSVYCASFTWSSEVQSVYTPDLIKIGLYSFPMGFGTEVGAMFSALTMRKLGRTNIQLTAACFFLTLFVALLATLTPNSIRPALAYLSLAGIANGFVQVLIPAMIQLTNPDQHIGAVTGLLILFRYLGGAAGILMSLTILRSRVASTWASNVAKVTTPLGLPETSIPLLLGALQSGNTSMILQVPGISLPVIGVAGKATKTTYSHAFRITYYPILGLGVAATILAYIFAPDVTSRMDSSLAVSHFQPRFLRGKAHRNRQTGSSTTGS